MTKEIFGGNGGSMKLQINKSTKTIKIYQKNGCNNTYYRSVYTTLSNQQEIEEVLRMTYNDIRSWIRNSQDFQIWR